MHTGGNFSVGKVNCREFATEKNYESDNEKNVQLSSLLYCFERSKYFQYKFIVSSLLISSQFEWRKIDFFAIRVKEIANKMPWPSSINLLDPQMDLLRVEQVSPYVILLQ